MPGSCSCCISLRRLALRIGYVSGSRRSSLGGSRSSCLTVFLARHHPVPLCKCMVRTRRSLDRLYIIPSGYTVRSIFSTIHHRYTSLLWYRTSMVLTTVLSAASGSLALSAHCSRLRSPQLTAGLGRPRKQLWHLDSAGSWAWSGCGPAASSVEWLHLQLIAIAPAIAEDCSLNERERDHP